MNDDLYLTPLGWSAIIVGIGIFYLINEYVEPWIVETTCRELIKCD